MSFVETTLATDRPERVRDVQLPRRLAYHASPADWRDEVIYFLLPDRFSNGLELPGNLLDPSQRIQHRPPGWRWDVWAKSGDRYQGGTLAGVASKLDYL